MYNAQQAREDMIKSIQGDAPERLERWLNFIRDMASMGKSHTLIHVFADKKNPAHMKPEEIDTLESLGYKLEWTPERHAFKITWDK